MTDARAGSNPNRRPEVAELSFPTVTVILLIHQPGTLELDTIEALTRQRYPGSFKISVIDSSRNPAAAPNELIKQAAQQWEFIAPEDFGHGVTRNRALDQCESKVIVYLSQDACPTSDGWLKALVTPLATGVADASYGRQQSRSQDDERDATYSFLYPEAPSVKTKAQIKELGLKTFHFSNVSSAFVADTLRKVRFPEDISTFEDIGVAKRLLDAGGRLAYVPDAAVLHSHRMGMWGMFRRYRDIGRIYEQLGIFRELKQAKPSVTEGVRVARAVTPSSGGLASRGRSVWVLTVKAGAVALGRCEFLARGRLSRARDDVTQGVD